MDESLYHDLVQSIVSAIEARDPHTAEHSLRVGDMAENLCRLLGLPEAELTEIHMAAHVHDLGKIALPDRILLRRSRLTEEEHALMREHPRIGAEILARSEGLRGIATIVLHHHERWDGCGYPDGLDGCAIPRGSRIICITDSIDAMLGKRKRSKALSQDDCKRELEREAGRKFDPELAAFTLVHWNEIAGPINFQDRADTESATLAGVAPSVADRRPLTCVVPQ